MQGLQNILAGDQCMTVYKAIKQEADEAAEAGHRAGQGRDGQHRADGEGPGVRQGRPGRAADAGLHHQGQRQGRRRRRLRHQGRAVHRRLRGGRAPRPASPEPSLDAPAPRRDLRAAPAAGVYRTEGGFGDRSPNHDPCWSCAGSTRASARSRCCTTSTSSVYPGEVTALVGDNGAGKSTLVKCVSGIYTADSGEFLFDGAAGHHPQPPRRRRAGHRGRLPGPRAVRQPRHRARTCSSAGNAAAASCSTSRPWSRWPPRRSPASRSAP